MEKIYQAGDAIESKCNCCKDVRMHVVVAMNGGEIVKVQCKTCGSTHRHPKVKTAAPRKKGVRAVAKAVKALKSAAEQVQEWENALNGKDIGSAKPFGSAGSAVEGGLIDHPKFGVGLVQKLVAPNKMEVLFRNGSKLMVQAF
ncbi:MAG: hypothetical protein V3573_02385 [Desulfovibrionaceae bacterium]